MVGVQYKILKLLDYFFLGITNSLQFIVLAFLSLTCPIVKLPYNFDIFFFEGSFHQI